MAAHAQLKNEFMEDEKYHNVMTRLICYYYPKNLPYADTVMCQKDACCVNTDQTALSV